MKKIERGQNGMSRITTIIQTEAFYRGYLENVFYIGKIAKTPENDLAFETGAWAFFEKSFEVAESLEVKK